MGFLLHFVFFLLIKNVISCLVDQCRILAFPSTLFFVGERLVNHTIANISVIDKDTCEYRCYVDHNCVSVNFYFGENGAEAHNCELNNSTSKEHDKDLVKATNYVYHGTKNACGRAHCNNNAICQSGLTNKGYRCLCSVGFTGAHCEQDIDECTKKTYGCDVNAECHNTEGSFFCKCKAGYVGNGQNCAEILDCAQTPCHNGGACTNEGDGYRCKCLHGFTGTYCETGYINSSNILSKNESYFAYLRGFLVPAVGNNTGWLLCYRASLHGWAGEEFHTRCDGKGNIVTFIQTDQYVFGGYTDIPWGCSPGARTEDQSGRCCVFPFKYKGHTYNQCILGKLFKRWCSFDAVYSRHWAYCDDDPYKGYHTTDKAFIFSLKNKEGLAPFKSMVNHDSQAIYMEISRGPTFGGGHDIHIANNAGHNVHSYTDFGHSFLAPSEVKEKDTVLAGTHHFTPDEVEVFYLP
nr:protein kinase C-binding protein NELL2-like [Pocillopora verrucosa]